MKFAILIYIFSIIAANLLVNKLGPFIMPIIAFVLIGFDLSLRDWLQLRIKKWQMGCLILFAGLLTFVINASAVKIAIASSIAFTVSGLIDWFVFTKTRGSWMFRSNASNTASAAIDSLLFPTIAFGVLMPEIVLMQFVAKVSGGAIWSYILKQKNTI